MRYLDILSYPRHHDEKRFLVVAHVKIEAAQLRQFEDMVADQTQTCVLGHDLIGDGEIVVHVGCATDDVRHAIENAWD